MSRNAINSIIAYNQRFVDRYDLLLKKKMQNLAKSPFKFFRGTFHLYAQDIAEQTLAGPPVDLPASGSLAVVGDIHGENYGTYKADDGTLRYGINDFDETTSTLLNFDCRRACVGLLLAAREIGVNDAKTNAALRAFGSAYWEQLLAAARDDAAEPKEISDRQPPQATVVRTLIEDAAAKRRADVMAELTEKTPTGLQLKRGEKFFELKPADRQQGERLLADYTARLSGSKREVVTGARLLDLCGRVAGCGSLGRYRYVALLALPEAKDKKTLLLEFKEALPSAWDEFGAKPASQQPADAKDHHKTAKSPATSKSPGPSKAPDMSRAAEVSAVERAMQPASNGYLGFAIDGAASFQTRELGPHDSRLEWSAVKREHEFGDIAELHATILANAHVRAAVKHPESHARLRKLCEEIEPHQEDFLVDLAQFAQAYAGIVGADHTIFQQRRLDVERALRLQ